ncbi:MerR family transcriptional regulator [Pseudomonas sp. HR96]|uniref:MerR family transcriptional regulator n=1 Tax=Pseudomonas sp. HR96 TaxID=1027966 RepID=UPI002A75461F|nr:MerR family transcriptional regulator [Pseudomonas sp. HR96]WPP00712.1 MerR family transcriptional regulator [Pseudomonas sp. HR96]
MNDSAAPAISPDDSGQELLPIREVSRLTGINPVTLRAWERRYGLVQPIRTESGHRLYSQANIEEVRQILGWIERGVPVGKVERILARSESLRSQAPDPSTAPGEWAEWQARVRRAVGEFDERLLEQVYGQIFSSYPLVVVFQEIFMPVWVQLLAERERFGQLSEWLLLDGFLRGRTLQRLQLHNGLPAHLGRVLVAAVPGECRELELLVAGLMLVSGDIEVRVLPFGQPLEELSLICDKVRPEALVLYSTHPPATDAGKGWARLALSLECPLLLAGELSELAHDSFVGAPIVCLGSDGRFMQRRLQQFLEGHLDS